MHRLEMQALAVKFSQRAEDCFELAAAQHERADLHQKNADLHTSADKLRALGMVLLADAAELFGESDFRAACYRRYGEAA